MTIYEITVAVAGSALGSGAVVAGVMTWWTGVLSRKLAPVWDRLDDHAGRITTLEAGTALVGHERDCPARAAHGPAAAVRS